MAHDIHDPLKHPEVQIANGWGYVASYVLSALLMAGVLVVVVYPSFVAMASFALPAAAALAVLIQIVLLFQLGFSKTHAWTTISFLLIVPLFVIAVGLTIWMFNSLDARTMMAGLMH